MQPAGELPCTHSAPGATDSAGPEEEDNRTEEQADAACELPCTHSTPGTTDGAGLAEEDNRTEEQADAACEPPCTHSTPGATDSAGLAEDRNVASATGPAVPEEISELEWMQKRVRANKKGRRQEPRVFRKTELHDRPSSIFSTRAAGKKPQAVHHPDEPEFPVPEELQEFAESLLGHLDGVAEDLWLQVALVDEQVSDLDKMFRKTTRQFERRIADLEERGWS